MKTNTIQALWKDKLEKGISNVCFSNDGTMVAAAALDDDHSIAIYDVKRGMKFRQNAKLQDQGLVVFGKGTKSVILDLRFDSTGK